MKAFDGAKHFSIIGENAKEGINGSQCDYAPVVKVQIRSIEGEIETCCDSFVVECSLGHGANNGQTVLPRRKSVIGLGH